MDRVRRVFLVESLSSISSAGEQPKRKRLKQQRSEPALRPMQPRDEGTKQQCVPVLLAGPYRHASIDALISPSTSERRVSTPKDGLPTTITLPFRQTHLSKRIRKPTIEIVTTPCTPTQLEPKKNRLEQSPGPLLHLVEQQAGFMNEQQIIISQLIRHLERMDMLLRSQQCMTAQYKTLPTPPSPPPAETKDATTSTSTPTGTPTPSRAPTPFHPYNLLGAPDYRSVSAPPCEYLAHITTTTPRSSYGPPISLQSDESAAALDRIAEEIADTYDALSICSQHADTVPCSRTSVGAHSTEFHAYTNITPPSEHSGFPTAPSSCHVSRTSDYSTLNRIHHVQRVAPLKHSRSTADMDGMRIPELGCEPESPVLPKSTGELTPPISPTVAAVECGRLPPVARGDGRGDGSWGQWYQGPDGRFYCRASGAGAELHEGGYI